MTVPERLDLLRKYARDVRWHFDEQSMQFVGIMHKSGVKCTIGKLATINKIKNLAFKVQRELRETNAKIK